MTFQHKIHWGVLLGLALLISCAQPGRPTGGPKDEVPPEVVSTSPATRTLNYSGKTLKFVFSEAIKKPSFDQEIFVSPFVKTPQIQLSDNGKRLSVEFQEDLRPNTTYVITLNGIRDNHEGNEMDETYILAFSTGDQLDSLSIVGDIVSPIIGEQVKDMTVLLFDADSIQQNDFLRKRPAYLAKADAQGKFEFQYLRNADYRILAVKDDDKSNTYSGGLEPVAMSLDTVLRFELDTTERDSVAFLPFPVDSLASDSATIDSVKELVGKPDTVRVDTLVVDSLELDTGMTDSLLVDSMMNEVVPIDSSTILVVTLYAFTPDPYFPNVKNYDWVADSTLVLRFTKNLRLENLRMYATDTLGNDSVALNTYSWLVGENYELFVHMLRPSDVYSTLHLSGLMDSMERPLDSVFRVLPSKRSDSYKEPILSNSKLNRILGGWELFTPRLYRPGKAALFLTDTSWASPDTLSIAIRDSGFRFYLAPSPAPDTVIPYFLRIGGAWTQPEDTSYADSTFIYPLQWYDPAEYGAVGGRLVLDSPFVPPIVMNLLDAQKQVVGTVRDTLFFFPSLPQGEYTTEVIFDTDSSGHWTTGDLAIRRLPEKIFRPQGQLTVRANWELLDQEVLVSLNRQQSLAADTAAVDSAPPPTRVFGDPSLRPTRSARPRP